MKKTKAITTLFLDIGGVLLTDGWGTRSRQLAVQKFNLDPEETEERHHMVFDTYEVGKLSLQEYLEKVVFYKRRNFTEKQFRQFMHSQSKCFIDMVELVRKVKKKYELKIAVVSNEGRELNEYRIRKFQLGRCVDFFISSSFVHFRKPDADIFKIALDIAQVAASEVLYIEDRPLFLEVAAKLGIRGIHHLDAATTAKELKRFGLNAD